MKALAAPRSDNDQRPLSPENASGVRCNGLGWTACPCLLQLYHARDATVQRARPAWTETLAGHRRFSKCATLLPLESPRTEPQRPPGNGPEKGRSERRADPVRRIDLRTRETGALGQPFGERPLEEPRGHRVWDPTFGRGRQRSEGRTPGHLRGARRDVRRPPAILGGCRRTERHRRFSGHKF